MKTLATLLALCSTMQLQAQLPKTDMYLLKVFNNGEKVRIKEPSYLSGFNPDGYNNQPSFVSPQEVVISTNMYDGIYTDIVSLDLLSKEYRRVTATDSISEYSPTPNAAEGFMSTVRVEKDGVTQSLHLYPNDHSSSGRRVLPDLNTVGYHSWVSVTEVVLYLVTEPHSLVIADINTGKQQKICDNPGRCLRQYQGSNLLYIHKVTPDLWYLKKYDLGSGTSETVIQTLPASEDFTLLSDGTVLMASGSSIYAMHPDRDTEWAEAVDLYEYGIKNITRMASSRNKLIIVNTK